MEISLYDDKDKEGENFKIERVVALK